MEPAGEQDGETVWRVTKWTPREISLTAVPADSTVGVGRSAQFNPKPMNPTNPSQPTKPAHRMTRTQEQEHADRIRGFYDALRNPAWKRAGAEIGERCIVEGRTFEEFRALALPHFTDDSGVTGDLPTSDGSNGWSGHRFGDTHNPMNNRSVGAQIVAHRDFQQLLRGGKKMVAFELPGISRVRSMGTADFGGTVQHLGAPVFENQRLTIADLLAVGMMGSGTVRYPREDSFVPGAGTVGEAGQKPEQAFDVSPVDAPARKIAAWTRISTELLQDSPAAEAYINSRLEFAVLRKEEEQILFGDSMGNNLTGIFTNPGIQLQVKGADTATDAIRKGIGNIAINSDFEASGIVLHPLDWQNIELLKDTTGQYLCGNIFVRGEMGQIIKAPSLFGVPVVVTKATTAGKALVGDFARAAQLFRRTGLLIEISNQDADNFTRNLATILAELRALVATYAPAAFCEVTGL